MKEKKFNWSFAGIKQIAGVNPEGLAPFEASLVCRQLSGLMVMPVFWGSFKGLPGGALSQAEAVIRAAVTQPVSIEGLARFCRSTVDNQHVAEGLNQI